MYTLGIFFSLFTLSECFIQSQLGIEKKIYITVILYYIGTRRTRIKNFIGSRLKKNVLGFVFSRIVHVLYYYGYDNAAAPRAAHTRIAYALLAWIEMTRFDTRLYNITRVVFTYKNYNKNMK